MVKQVAVSSITEAADDALTLNENGKRPGDTLNNNGKKKLKTKSLYRQPTVNELNRLQETETLFNSNLFRLQVEEILEEVKVKEKVEKKFQKWYTEFKNHLLAIPKDDNEYDLTDQALQKKLKVKLPISSKLNKTKCVFKFHKFSDIQTVGSYSLGCAINSKLIVDIQVTMPADTYTKNDSINYRYHKKRAAYLAYIASHIKDHETVESVKFSWLNLCETNPVLEVTPSGKMSKYLSVRIDLVCEPEAYKLHRFSPLRNNLREGWLFNEDNPESIKEVGPSTPYYNSSILQHLTNSVNEEFLKVSLLKSDNLKQAVVLIKIWLRQRKLQVSGYIVSMLVFYLVQIKRINNIMSSYQIVRNVWIALKASEWDTKGISLHKGEGTPSIEEFHQHFPVVFLDNSGYYNICWQMCKGTYQALKRESMLAVEMLDNGKINSFLPLFMVPVQPLMHFDHILMFKDVQELKHLVKTKADKPLQLNYGVDDLALVTHTLHSVLVKGLGDRVDLVLQMVEADLSWSINKTPEKAMKEGYQQKLSFAFILNPDNYMNIVEKGPPANLPEAEQFRAFWGEKSELRRFQDGSITEACVWSADTLADRRGITRQILDYLMHKKFDVPESQLFHIGEQLETLLSRRAYATQVEESSLRVLRAFDDLRRDLRQLTQLPLDVSAVYGISPVFSYCEPLPAVPRGARNPWRRGDAALVKKIERGDGTLVVPEFVPVNRCIMELGHSGKWPGDLEAFRCLKAAFHLQISDRLKQQYSLPSQAYANHIDVLKDGLVFRLQIAHPKEITLLRKGVEDGVAKFRESDESLRLRRETVLLPRLRGALHGLQQQQPAFGPTACVLRRWVSAQLVCAAQWPAPLAELLAAAAFLRPAPAAAPRAPAAGFLRALRLLADTDWAREMVVLDFNGDMKREEITELERQFSSRQDPTPRIHIVTSHDGDLPGVWGAHAPDPLVIARVQTLARSTLKYIEGALMEQMKDNILGAFVPSLAGYDVVIRLRRELVPHAAERVDAEPIRRQLRDVEDAQVIPVVEFHPVRKYLEELRSAYSEFAVFFHDCFGGEVIAVLWKPDVHEYKEFQLSNANALKPVEVDGETKYKVNLEAIVEDFRLLGEGLVTDIDVNT